MPPFAGSEPVVRRFGSIANHRLQGSWIAQPEARATPSNDRARRSVAAVTYVRSASIRHRTRGAAVV